MPAAHWMSSLPQKPKGNQEHAIPQTIPAGFFTDTHTWLGLWSKISLRQFNTAMSKTFILTYFKLKMKLMYRCGQKGQYTHNGHECPCIWAFKCLFEQLIF